jgi:hypothetical protein
MSDLALTRDDVEKVERAAYRAKDGAEGSGSTDEDEIVVSMEVLIDFCGVLLGRESVDSFLRGQDMDT